MTKSPIWIFFERTVRLSRLDCEVKVPFTLVPLATFNECMKRPAFISEDQIGSYIERGFNQFKIAGRGMPESYVIDSYVYFLAKPEYRDIVRNKINTSLRDLRIQASSGGKGKRI